MFVNKALITMCLPFTEQTEEPLFGFPGRALVHFFYGFSHRIGWIEPI